MINVTMLWLMLVPILCGAFLWYKMQHRDKHKIAAAYTVVSMLIVGASFFLSAGLATYDIEIWNGKVTGKERVHGSYQRSYDCNCRQECSGSGESRSCDEVCDTCYEDRYTVDWFCDTTVGRITIESLDSGSRSVYNKPDPQRWLSIVIGEPASKRNRYTNYVQAVPESLFQPSSSTLRSLFANLIVPYPDNVYDFYRIDRFISPGHSFADARQWNDDIGNMLRELGPRKQVNAIVVVAKTDDPRYEFALRDAWEGANKNDVVLIIGSTELPRIDFVRVLSWTKAENFKIELRDSIEDLGDIDRQAIMSLLAEQIEKNFVRRQMAEFEYLKAEINPPIWLNVTIMIFLILAMIGIWFHTSNKIPRNAFQLSRRNRYRR